MALKLGELVAYLRVDKSDFRRGLAEGKREFAAAGRDMERDADKHGKAIGAALAADAVQTGTKIGVSTSKGIFAAMDVSLSSLPPHVQTALAVGMAGAIAAAAPVIGAAITGAIGGGVGAGAMAAGIASAGQSPQVRAAWQDLADEGADVFRGFGLPFVGPTVEAIGILRGTLRDASGDLDAIADNASRFVGPTTRGVAGFLRETVAGVRELTDEADPIFDMLDSELPRLGASVRSFFRSMGRGAEGGADALRALLRITEVVLPLVGTQFEIWAKQVDLAADASQKLAIFAGPAAMLFSDPQTAKIKRAGNAFGDVAGAADDVRWSVKGMSDAFSDWLGLSLDAEGAADRFKLSLYDLDDAVKDNGKSLADNTEGGLRNQQVIRDMIGLADRQRQAEIDRAGGTEESIARANAAYDANIRQLIEVGVKAGLSRAELTKLAGSYGVNVYMTGLETIRRQLQALSAAARVVPGLAGAAIGFNLAAGIIAAGIEARAAGGPTAAGQAYWVGEQGPELWVAPANGRIIPHGESVAAVSPPAATGTPATPVDPPVVNVYIGGERLDARIDYRVETAMDGEARAVSSGVRA